MIVMRLKMDAILMNARLSLQWNACDHNFVPKRLGSRSSDLCEIRALVNSCCVDMRSSFLGGSC
jgi:hypothetical protein